MRHTDHRTPARLTTPLALLLGAVAPAIAPAEETNTNSPGESLAHELLGKTADGEPRLELNGLVEVEASAAEGFDGDDTSDLILATVELGAEARINRAVSANVLLLFEEDTREDIEVDNAFVTVAPPEQPFDLKAGRFYVPFGRYNTALIDDPLPLELGETRETAVRAGYAQSGFEIGAWAFKGDSDGNNIGQYGLHARYRRDGELLNLAIGVSLISSIADADNLTALIEATGRVDQLDEAVSGWNTHARIASGGWTLTGEYLAAADAFAASEFAFQGSGAQPEAWQLELAYQLPWQRLPVTTALGLQGTDEALALGLPEQRALAGITVEPWQATSLSLQLAHDRDYGTSDGGSGNSAESALVQLAVSF
jgi:hypothetical protein